MAQQIPIEEECLVDNQVHAIRVSEFVLMHFTALPTRNGMKKAFKASRILINDKVAQTGDFISGGERVVLLQALQEKPLAKIGLPLEVLFEDDYLAIINRRSRIYCF